jgi:hypothetical protein
MVKGACYGTALYSYTEQCGAHWKLGKGLRMGLNFYKFMQVTGKCEIIQNFGRTQVVYQRPEYFSRYSDSLRLDGRGIESRWGRDFPHSSRPALGPTQPPIQWVPCLSRGKAAGAFRWPPTPSRAQVKERVEIYLYSPSGTSWPGLGWTLPLPLPHGLLNEAEEWEVFIEQINRTIQGEKKK